jgi:predicted nuclease of predicted toxin-antitoxin system
VSADASVIRFFIDHCVPESVAKALEGAGREVIRLRTRTAPDSPDPVVADIAEANDAVLVTMDADFKGLASRSGIGKRRFRKLSLVRFERCRESRAAERMLAVLSLVDHEWALGRARPDRRIFIVVGQETIRIHR